MASLNESSEGDIWDYQPRAIKNERASESKQTKLCRVEKRKSSTDLRFKSKCQGSSDIQIASTSHKKSNTFKDKVAVCSNYINDSEVIDVDSEDVVCPVLSKPMDHSKEKWQTLFSRVSSPHHSNCSNNESGKKTVKNARRKSVSKQGSVLKVRKLSESKDSREAKGLANIKTYLSPKKLSIHVTDVDDFTALKTSTPSVSENERLSVGESNEDLPHQHDQDSVPLNTSKAKSTPNEEGISKITSGVYSNSEMEDEKNQSTSLDVNGEDKSRLSSPESENRGKSLSVDEELKTHNFCVVDVCVIAEDGSAISLEHSKNIIKQDLPSSTKEDKSDAQNCELRAENTKCDKASPSQSNDSSDTETEVVDDKSCTGSSQVMESCFDADSLPKGPASDVGGFFFDDDDNLDAMADIACVKADNALSGTKMSVSSETVSKPALSSSYSCPPLASSAVKQTTLFSFLKVKPGSLIKSNSSADMIQKTGKAGSGLGKPSSSSSSGQGTYASEPTDEYETYYGKGKKRQCPFYKKIPGTAITVDAFRYGVIPGCEAYVLTHFHYDHYGGLTKKFAQPIFCSQVTGNLVQSRIGVDQKWINRLPMWKPCTVGGVTLTLMEANHCPGAVIILFELKDGRKVLHTGDFRASPDMESYSALQGIQISDLYLDTTYCNPSYAFPDQKEVVEFVVNLVLDYICDNPSTLIVCGAYTIGKERIFSAIAKALDSKICVMNDKKKVLDCLEDVELKSRVTLDWSQGRVHVLPMAKLNQQQLKDHHSRHSQFKTVLAFQPTGWTHSGKQPSLQSLKPKWSKDGITLYGVPYSEHSSYLELKRFVQHFRPRKILPTVNNGSPAARSKMDAIFREWMHEKL